MVGLLLDYSADPSVVDLTRLDETMIKVLKREITIFDTSDDESLSPSSPITSADDEEYDDEEKIDKNLLQSSSTYIPKIQQKKVISKPSVFIYSNLFVFLVSLLIIFLNIHRILYQIINLVQWIVMYQEKIHMILKVMMTMKQLKILNNEQSVVLQMTVMILKIK